MSRPGRRARRIVALERDGATCTWCGRAVEHRLVQATTEHVVPRVKGGPSWPENEVVACGRCNRERGHRTPADFLDECERRGWPADRPRVVRALDAFVVATLARGGQRRARAYAERQLRRLRRTI